MRVMFQSDQYSRRTISSKHDSGDAPMLNCNPATLQACNPASLLPVTLLPCNLTARDSVRPGGKADRACVRLGSSGGTTRPNYKLLSGLSVRSQSSTDLH